MNAGDNLGRYAEAATAAERASDLEHPQPEKVHNLRILITVTAKPSPGNADSTP